MQSGRSPVGPVPRSRSGWDWDAGWDWNWHPAFGEDRDSGWDWNWHPDFGEDRDADSVERRQHGGGQAPWQDKRVNTVVPTPAGNRSSATLRRAWALIAVASVLTVTACTGSLTPSEPSDGVDGAVPSSTDSQSGAEDTAGGPGTTPSSDAEPQSPDSVDQPSAEDPAAGGTRIADAVETALQALAASQSSVTSEQVRSAIEQGFNDAGVVADGIEVSIDSTPTGLDVDAIQGAGRSGETCVFGEVREGDISVSVLPVLASGYCFVGDQR